MKTHTFDLCVVGAGAAGVYAAIQTAKLGHSVVLVEKSPESLGGSWIEKGTLASKTLREVVSSISQTESHIGRHWRDRIFADLSFETMTRRAKEVSRKEKETVLKNLKKNGVTLFYGAVKFVENISAVFDLELVTETATTEQIRASKVIIATGSRPRRPSDIPFDGWRVIDSDEILQQRSLPQQIIVYGGGVIGCEYASILGAAGYEVELVESKPELLSHVDQEVVKELIATLNRSRVKTRTGYTLKEVSCNDTTVTLVSDNAEKLQAGLLLFAAGRVANSDGLNLEAFHAKGLKVDARGTILVDERYQTGVEGLFAVGDVVGPPGLAATSFEQGRQAVCHAFSCETIYRRASSFTPDSGTKIFPVGIYTIPELSTIGISEEAAIKAAIPHVVGRAYFREVARGIIRGEELGLLKIIVHKEHRTLLGVHIIGPDACNLIHCGMAVMSYGGTVEDLIEKFIFNYPTLSETYRIAAFNALNKILNIGKKSAA